MISSENMTGLHFLLMTSLKKKSVEDTTQGMNLQQGISSSLLAKLEGAQSVLNSGNPNSHQTAINKINSFKNEVEAQRGQFITNGQANLLIAMANNIIAQL